MKETLKQKIKRRFMERRLGFYDDESSLSSESSRSASASRLYDANPLRSDTTEPPEHDPVERKK